MIEIYVIVFCYNKLDVSIETMEILTISTLVTTKLFELHFFLVIYTWQLFSDHEAGVAFFAHWLPGEMA